ncbi:MAG: MerR family transcriptional regulator [Bacteroidetes bacterium]|nr:MerR family transcriptional regulator [Bacteroidota bacterium]
MSTFSIKDIETLTGIKSHTIRIWEQRYELLQPKRTDTNIRYYDDDDLKFLLNVSLLNRNGVKISKIAGLSLIDLEKLVGEITSDSSDISIQIHKLTAATLNLDEHEFTLIINNHCSLNGFEYTMYNLIFPFMSHLGVMWQSGTVNPAFEHFITNIIRARLVVMTEMLGARPSSSSIKKAILFCPEGEYHEIGLLFANYMLRNYGFHTLYLGQNIPVRDVEVIAASFNPSLIFVSFTSSNNAKTLRKNIEALENFKANVPLLLSGRMISAQLMQIPIQASVINNLQDFYQTIEKV